MSALNDQPEGFRIDASFGLDEETEEQLRELAWGIVLRGVIDPDEFVDAATDDELLDEETATAVFASVVEVRRRQQASFGELAPTSLSDAFAELERRGVVARQNFSCCGNCASGEIWDERPAGRPSRGYVYFHSQDTDSLLDSNETYIGYGAFPDAFISESEWKALDHAGRSARYEKEVLALMNETVIPVLEDHGIDVVWNRSLGTRILLRNVEYYAPI